MRSVRVIPTEAELEALFGARGTYEAEKQLRDAMENGMAICRRLAIPELTHEQVTEVFGPRNLFSGGWEHQQICASVAYWLHALGLWDGAQCIDYLGGRSDLATPGRTLFVECGNTSADKVLRAISGWFSRPPEGVLVVPFLYRFAPVPPGEPLRGYHFKGTKALARQRKREFIENHPSRGIGL